MTKSQWKLIEVWCVVILFFVVLGAFQNSKVIPFIAFIAAGLYLIQNSRKYKNINNYFLPLSEIISNSKFLRLFTFAYLVIITAVTFYFLFSGKNIGQYINSFWKLLFFLMSPFIIPLVFSQIILFKRLGENEL